MTPACADSKGGRIGGGGGKGGTMFVVVLSSGVGGGLVATKGKRNRFSRDIRS